MAIHQSIGDIMDRPSTVEEGLTNLVLQFGLDAVQKALFQRYPHRLKPTGDASRDRLVHERLGLRV